ncbi:MAG: cytochrome d ubiquinol oxidase subunit II [Clostridia bacterium]|nr:cytochrome d ubiquinol oxidase subunit II [Clostridia bacterium]
MDLNIAWFLLIGVLIIGYAILDGFDLGVGTLFYVLGKTDDEKKTLINSIGPVWDGNEVWLLTGGGALFAAFPLVYATVFSGFYLAMMLVLFGLIFRAVAVEYYFKLEGDNLQSLMGKMFFVGSLVPALLFGVAVGNVVKGIPIDPVTTDYTGSFFALLNPYALLLGVVGLVAFLLQGSAYTILKTEGELQARAKKLAHIFCWSLLVLWIAGGIAGKIAAPHLFDNYGLYPVLYLIPLLTLASMGLIPILLKMGHYGKVFLASSSAMATMILTLCAGIFPNWVIATNPAYNLTIYNASSSPLTLKIMLIIALIGVPIVLLYTGYVYYVFRGKADPHRQGY